MMTVFTDAATRFVLKDIPVRGIHVRLKDVWRQLRSRKHYPEPIAHALGELLAAAVLLAENLKFSGSLIVQAQGTGALKLLVAEATSEHTCRAVARWDENAPLEGDLRALLGEGGVLVLTLQRDGSEPWQGIVPLEGDSIAHMLSSYMKQSEQLQTELILGANDDEAGGLLLQRLPEQDMQDNAWDEAVMRVRTVRGEELMLESDKLVHRLFHDSQFDVFEPAPERFSCTCSRDKVGAMLLLLGPGEIESILKEEGSIEVGCDFCAQKYVFDEEDIDELFAEELLRKTQTQMGSDAPDSSIKH